MELREQLEDVLLVVKNVQDVVVQEDEVVMVQLAAQDFVEVDNVAVFGTSVDKLAVAEQFEDYDTS